MVDNVNYFPNVSDTSPIPSVLLPSDPQAGSGPVQQWQQFWRIGCCSSESYVGLGILLQQGDLKRNRGNARLDNVQKITVP